MKITDKIIEDTMISLKMFYNHLDTFNDLNNAVNSPNFKQEYISEQDINENREHLIKDISKLRENLNDFETYFVK